MTNGESFIDVDYAQRSKTGQFVAGDVFLSRKIKEEGRVISVLSDGLGSGVKASVLANLTATMAMKYTAAFEDIRRSAATIMDTLPICEVRKISYSTFTIVDLDSQGVTRVIEHGNPSLILLRGHEEHPVDRSEFTLDHWKDRVITFSELELQVGDRLIYCSDGITQAGMGQKGMPLGWGRDQAVQYLRQIVRDDPEISSQRLAQALVNEAFGHDGHAAKDDITAAVIYYRRPRRLLVITGPPFNKDRDRYLGELARSFTGRKVIAGGSTAGIVARELNRPVDMNLKDLHPDVPPTSVMEGIDLVTEGTLTLAKVVELLERGATDFSNYPAKPNAAQAMVRLMLESDLVDFVVGTRINEAHQDPNVPVELDLRRNIIRRIALLLEQHHLKETNIQFL